MRDVRREVLKRVIRRIGDLVRPTLGAAGAIAVCLAASPPAPAADMPDLPALADAAPRVVQEFATGWYLRGDVGWTLPDAGSATSSITAPNPTGSTIDNAAMVSVGGGLQYDWLRVDITGDYLARAKYHGTLVSSGDTTTSVEGAVALANVYVDLGTWMGVTPYIGAGLGASYLWTDGLVSPNITGNVTVPKTAQWNLAWALMAGASYRISDRMFVDGGYRYLSLGDAKTGEDMVGNQILLRDITAHEFRIGLRYLID